MTIEAVLMMGAAFLLSVGQLVVRDGAVRLDTQDTLRKLLEKEAERVTAMENTIKSVQSENAKLRAQIEALQQDKDRLQQDNVRLRQTTDAQEVEISHLRKEINELKRQKESA
jgi:peptidoglycan hydrolase CwlO-like protein